MYDYFDKHGKKFLAVVGSLLVLAFLLPSGFGRSGGSGGARLGKLNGERVEADQIQGGINTLRSLDRLVFPGGQTGQLTPIVEAILPNGLQRQFDSNPVLFYLLLNEAQQAGAAVSDVEVERYLRSPVKLIVDGQPVELDRVTPTIKDGLRDQLRKVLSIRANFFRAVSAIKMSKPLVDDELARQSQQIRVRVASFSAADFEKQVTAPTDEELRRQFTAYADNLPIVTKDNPFGFGYKVPDRIAVQWLLIPEGEVAKAVEATKSAELWDEDAIIYYDRNASDFTKVIPPSTQPTTQPFAAVRADVLKQLRAPLIEQQKRAIANRIVQQLTALHTAAARQPATSPGTFLGQPQYTFDSLNGVADAIQKQSGVRPTAVAPGGLLTREELAKQPGFGSAITSDRAAGFGHATDNLFDTLRALSNSDTAASQLDLGQPSAIYTAGGDLYVARVVGVEKAHAAKSLDEIKSQVERDVRRSHAFDAAAAAAQATLDKANTTGGLEKAATTVQTSDFFSSGTPTPAGLTGPDVAGLVSPAFEALRGVASAAALPARTLAKLPRSGQAAVIEVFDVKTTLTTTAEQETRGEVEQSLARSTVPPGLIEQWFSFDAVSRRVNYVADAPREDAPSPKAPVAPANPFMPG